MIAAIIGFIISFIFSIRFIVVLIQCILSHIHHTPIPHAVRSLVISAIIGVIGFCVGCGGVISILMSSKGRKTIASATAKAGSSAVSGIDSFFTFLTSPKRGYVASLEKAKNSTLKELEKRYGIPFQFVETYEERPLDMPTYMANYNSSSFYTKKLYGEIPEPQYYGYANSVFPYYVMAGMVEPVEAAGKPGFHTYQVRTTKNKVTDGAWAYFIAPEIERRITECWKNRPKDLPWLDKIQVEVRTVDVSLPKPVTEMTLEEITTFCKEELPDALMVHIYIYLPPEGMWKRLQTEYICKDRDNHYTFSDDPLEVTDNWDLRRAMDTMSKQKRKMIQYLKECPELEFLMKSGLVVFECRLDDRFMGQHGVLGTDVYSCHIESHDNQNPRFNWSNSTIDAMVNATQDNYASRTMEYYFDKTREDSRYLKLGNRNDYRGRVGIQWVQRKRIKRKTDSESQTTEVQPTGTLWTDPESKEVIEYDDDIKEESIIESDHGDWFCLDSSPIGGTIVLECKRPITGIVTIRNGYRFRKDGWENYARIKTLLITNMANGKQKRVTLEDNKSEQKVDLRSITESASFMNTYEMCIEETYPGNKWQAAALATLDVDLEEL